MRHVLYKKNITRLYVRQNIDWIFLFGDNMLRQGMGGQAAQMRGEPNAVGIITKRFPSMRPDSFLYEKDYEEARTWVDRDFAGIPDGVTVIIPYYGIGTGLARLKMTCPKLLEYIEKRIENL